MKALFGGVVLIVALGVVGFLYRSALEAPAHGGLCTLDAKICPDGTSVTRTGPRCEFAVCAPPNESLPDAGIAFVAPDGYTKVSSVTGAMLIAYEKNGTSTPKDSIHIEQFLIPEGKTANDVILEQTILLPSDMHAEDINQFSPRIIGSRTYLSITLERFEATVQTAYYLAREKDVLRFVVSQHRVGTWTDPDLIVDNLSEHQVLQRLLTSLDVLQ